METQSKSKELIALELALKTLDKFSPAGIAGTDSDAVGKSIAALYNSIYENLSIEY